MSYLNLLKNNFSIKIYDKNGKYTATTFFLKNSEIWINNHGLGILKHDIFTKNKQEFTKHINKMLEYGFCLDIVKN